MTAKFYNANDGSIIDFTSRQLCLDVDGGQKVNEADDMYYQVDIDKRDYSYAVYNYNGTKGNRIGKTGNSIKFYEKGAGIGINCITPTPTQTPTMTPTHTPTPTPTPTNNGGGLYFYGNIGYDPVLITEACSLVNTISMTGDTSSFCTSVIFTSNDIIASTLGTGDYYISYFGKYMQVSHINGTNIFTKTLSGDCQLCPGVISLSSGHTIASACTGTTQLYYYASNFGLNGTKIYTEPTLSDVAPGESGHPVYYYSYDYDMIYYIDDSEGRKYASSQNCPTPTPTTGTVTNAVVSLVDGQTACDGGDYGIAPSNNPLLDPKFFNLTIYGSNIQNASAIINIPNFLLADFTTNQQFYVRGRVTPNLYWKKFILDGDPSGGVTTATSSGAAVLCV